MTILLCILIITIRVVCTSHSQPNDKAVLWQCGTLNYAGKYQLQIIHRESICQVLSTAIRKKWETNQLHLSLINDIEFVITIRVISIKTILSFEITVLRNDSYTLQIYLVNMLLVLYKGYYWIIGNPLFKQSTTKMIYSFLIFSTSKAQIKIINFCSLGSI